MAPAPRILTRIEKLRSGRLRSFPRTRESRAQYAGSSLLPWIPAFAGMSGMFDIDSMLPPLRHPVEGRGAQRAELVLHDALAGRTLEVIDDHDVTRVLIRGE